MHNYRFLFVLTIFSTLLFPMVFAGMSSFRPLKNYKCIKVIDGDTVWLADTDKKFKVRLANIDAPESLQLAFSGEPVGKWSKDFLKNLILKKEVILQSIGKDLYGRDIGIIYLHGVNINLKMVRSGMAFYYPYKTTTFYRLSQMQAKLKRMGIWKAQGVLAPWIYRRKHH